MSENNLQTDSFYKYLISKGYYFDKYLIENFLLSLKVKPFEILTGNSGTGKTKLSQLFAKYIISNSIQLPSPDSKENCFHKIKVSTGARSWGFNKKNNKEGQECGWSPSWEYFKDVLPLNSIIGKYEIEIDGLKHNAEIEFVPQIYYDKNNKKLIEYFKELYKNEEEQIKEDKSNNVSHKKQMVDLGVECKGLLSVIDDDFGKNDDEISLTMTIDSYIARNRVMLPWELFDYVPFKKSVPCRITASGIMSNARFYPKFRLANQFNNDIKKYLKDLKQSGLDSFKLKIKNFKPYISNFNPKWDKFALDLENLDEYFESNDVNNGDLKYKIVPVGANWTDNTNIVGYYNVITEEYQSTPAYELIKKAQDDSDNPYFLILDEMNLSHVERYFSDFLSAIESGEEIPLYGNNETLKLPDNLFIIGTVNVDETTYMFSPKVLDRANTIEFNSLTARKYMSSNLDEGDFEGNIDYLQSPLIDSDISNSTIEDLKDILSEITYDENNLWDILAMELTKFQETLKGSGFDFGFRVINEILRFMVVAWRYENSPGDWENWERYFDAQIKQKILPKLHGSEKAIGNVLTKLFNICLVERNNNENPKNTTIGKDDCRYYTSALKLQEMSKVLADQRYVSFIN